MLNQEQKSWLEMADEYGNAVGAFNIAKYYLENNNLHAAEKYLSIAANNGHKNGMFRLGKLYYEQQNVELAKTWLRRAAELGSTKAEKLFSEL